MLGDPEIILGGEEPLPKLEIGDVVEAAAADVLIKLKYFALSIPISISI